MCYSSQIIQVAKKLSRQFGLRLDYDEAEKLFLRRLEDPSLIISRGFEFNFEEPQDNQQRRIKAAIDEHRGRVTTKLEQDLFTQKTRLVTAERSLQAKETKKARENVRIATNKIAALTDRLNSLRSVTPTLQDDQIFPMTYCGVIIRDGNDLVLTPMRYHCRPAGKRASVDRQFPGLYNGRRDNLTEFWRGQFGRTHCVAVFESFYEHVQVHDLERRELAAGEKPKSVVLHFQPRPPQPMLVAGLWSHWTGPSEPEVRGFAAITDEPPPEVAAAGHNRCIIPIQAQHVEAWLSPNGRSDDDLQAILDDRPTVYYEHAIAA